MSRCSDIRAGLDDWLDGVADARLRGEIDAHLAECDDCARLFQRHRRLDRDLRALAGAADRIAETPARLSRGRSRFLPPAWRVSAAVLLVACAGLYLTRPWQHEAAVQVTEAPSEAGQADKEGMSDAASYFRISVPKDHLAVPVESSDPRIHIVWLYKETQPPEALPGDDAGDASASPG